MKARILSSVCTTSGDHKQVHTPLQAKQ